MSKNWFRPNVRTVFVHTMIASILVHVCDGGYREIVTLSGGEFTYYGQLVIWRFFANYGLHTDRSQCGTTMFSHKEMVFT